MESEFSTAISKPVSPGSMPRMRALRSARQRWSFRRTWPGCLLPDAVELPKIVENISKSDGEAECAVQGGPFLQQEAVAPACQVEAAQEVVVWSPGSGHGGVQCDRPTFASKWMSYTGWGPTSPRCRSIRSSRRTCNRCTRYRPSRS